MNSETRKASIEFYGYNIQWQTCLELIAESNKNINPLELEEFLKRQVQCKKK